MPTKTTLFSDDFNRADTATGAANNTTAVGNTFKDVGGSTWHIATNKLQGDGSSDYQHHRCEQISYTTLDGGVRGKIVQSSATSIVTWIRTHSGSSENGYWAWLNNSIFATVSIGSTPTAAGGSAAGTQFMAGSYVVANGTYVLEHYALKTSSGNKTTVTIKLYDSGGTTLLDSYAYTDTTSGMQNSGTQSVSPLASGQTIDDWLSFSIPSRDAKTRNVIFEGDSLTAGTGASAAKWYYPAQALDFLGNDWSGSNQGHAGDTIDQMSTDAPTQVDANYDGAKDYNWVVIRAGTNNLITGESAASVYGKIKTYCQARKAANPLIRVCVVTIINRNESGLVAGWSTAALSVNSSITTNAVAEGWADCVADIAADSRFTPGSGDTSNTIWYNGDKIHCTDIGYMQQAIVVSEALRDTAPPAVTARPDLMWFFP